MDARRFLSCPPGSAGSYQADFSGDTPGGPASPEAALAELFERDGFRIDPSRLQLWARSGRQAQVVIFESERRVFTASVEFVGDSWRVHEFYACIDFLDRIAPG